MKVNVIVITCVAE